MQVNGTGTKDGSQIHAAPCTHHVPLPANDPKSSPQMATCRHRDRVLKMAASANIECDRRRWRKRGTAVHKMKKDFHGETVLGDGEVIRCQLCPSALHRFNLIYQFARTQR